jgi:hypothetical protein
MDIEKLIELELEGFIGQSSWKEARFTAERSKTEHSLHRRMLITIFLSFVTKESQEISHKKAFLLK